MIAVGGTDNNHSWDDSLITALETGSDISTYSDYLEDVKNAIKQYMAEHPELQKQGVQVTFAGYSLGGMTVQNLINQDSQFLQDQHLTVKNVITYGSPVMGPPQDGINYKMYDATYDPIPLLSSYENPLLTEGIGLAVPGFIPTAGMLEAAENEPWDVKLHTYIDPLGGYNIVGITDVGQYQGPNLKNVLNNHMQYNQSSQLNAPDTAVDIDPSSFGPTEYFPMSDTQ